MKKLIAFALTLILLLGAINLSVFAAQTVASTSKLSVKGVNGGAEIYVDGEYKGETPYSAKIATGAEVTLVTDDEQFICYADANRNALSESKTYTFSYTGQELIYVFSANTQKTMVIYRNTNDTKQILSYATYSDISVMETHLVDNASIFGMQFLSWDKTVDQIIALAKEGQKVIYVTPTYTTSTATCDVTALNGTVNGGSTDTVYVGAQITLVAKEAPEGQKFAYWTNANGDIIGNKATMTMQALYTETYRAVFVGENDPVIILPSTSVKCGYLEENNRVEIFTQRFIPDGFTVKANGLLYAKDSDLDEDYMVLENVDNATLSRISHSIATYSGFVRNTASCEEYITLRPFITYEKDGQTFTVYGSKVTAYKQHEQTVLIDEDFESLSEISVDSMSARNALAVNATSGLAIESVNGNQVASTGASGGYISFNGTKNEIVVGKNIAISFDLVLEEYPTSTMSLANFVCNKTVNYYLLRLNSEGYLLGSKENITGQDGEGVKLELNTSYHIEMFWDVDTGMYSVRINGQFTDGLAYGALVSKISSMVPYFLQSGKGGAATIDNIKLVASNKDIARVPLSSVSDYSDVYIVANTDKDAIDYAVGENITFSFDVRNGGMGAYADKIRLDVRTDSDPDVETVYLDGTLGVVTYTLKLDEPGFVYIEASACNENGKKCSGSETATLGAGASIRDITTAAAKSDDFDTFWQNNVDALLEIEPEIIEMTSIKETDTYIAYKVKIRAVDDSAVFSDGETHDYVSGVITVPKNKTGLGFSLGFQSYSTYAGSVSYDENNIVFSVCAHSIEPYESSTYYTNLKNGDLKKHGREASDNTDAETVYFKNMLLRNLQAIRFLIDYYGADGENLWNGTDIRLSGGSQGGFQAAATTGLAMGFADIEVTSLSVAYPWLCDIYGGDGERIPSTFWIDYYNYKVVQYVDTAFFGEYITCKTRIETGLGDTVARVTGVTALYNAIASTDKSITYVQNKGHADTGVHAPEFTVSN